MELNGAKWKLTNLQLHKGTKCNDPSYYLSAEYKAIDSNNGKYKLEIPKIEFPVIDYPSIDMHVEEIPSGTYFNKTELTLFGDVSLPLSKDEMGNAFYVKTIEKQMTISDIEKELGYKVKIVSDNKEN